MSRRYNPQRQCRSRGAITPVSDLDLSRLGGNLVTAYRDVEWRGTAPLPITTVMHRKACKIYTHGTVLNQVPCTRCADGLGPFKQCVVAWDESGYVAKGVCANCYWFSRIYACTRRHELPCQALADAGNELGDFMEACRIACDGAHIHSSEKDTMDDRRDEGDEGDESSEEMQVKNEEETESYRGFQRARDSEEEDFDILESIEHDIDWTEESGSHDQEREYGIDESGDNQRKRKTVSDSSDGSKMHDTKRKRESVSRRITRSITANARSHGAKE